MVYAAGVLIVLALIFGPSLWVKLVMRRYSSEKPEMPYWWRARRAFN